MILENVRNVLSNSIDDNKETTPDIITITKELNEIYTIESAIESDMYKIDIFINILNIKDEDTISYAIEASSGNNPISNIKDTIVKIIKWLKDKLLTIVSKIKEWIDKFINWIIGNKPVEKVLEHLENLEKEIDKKTLKQKNMDDEDVKYIVNKIPVLFTNAYDGNVKSDIIQDKKEASINELEKLIMAQIDIVVKTINISNSINNNMEKSIKELAKIDMTKYNKLLSTILKIINTYKIGVVLTLTPKEAVIYKIKEKNKDRYSILIPDYKSYNLTKLVKDVKTVKVPEPNDIKVLKAICKKIIENKKYLEDIKKELDKSYIVLKTIAKEIEKVTNDITKIRIMKDLALVYRIAFINSKRLVIKTAKSLMLPTYIYDFTKNTAKYYGDKEEKHYEDKKESAFKLIENKR